MRVAGVLFAVAMVGFALVTRRRRQLSRADLFGWLSFATAVASLSAVPRTANFLADTLRLQNRLFAVLVTSVGLLFVFRLRDARRIRHLESRLGGMVRNLAIREFQQGALEVGSGPKVSIVIAAYNEEQAIEGVLSELPREVAGLPVEPIVVVDGGDDDTESIVRRAGYFVVTHSVNRGQGDALRTGFTAALRRGADVVVTMDADGQHRPDQLDDLVKPIVHDAADYVQGSRFLGTYDDAGGARDLGIRLFNRVINLLGRVEITDCTNGYRAIRGDRLAQLRLEEDRFSAPEIIMESARHGLRMKEVPVHIRTRSHGDSKKPRRLGYPIGFLRTIFRVWLR